MIQNDYERARYTRDRSKRQELNRRCFLKRAYGITPEEYDVMLEAQGGVCAACGRPPKRYRLSVDHNHRTGQVRGLLCAPCNRAVGFLADDPGRAMGVAAYLERARG